MNESEFEYLVPLGERHGGVEYNVGVRLNPSINNVQSFAVILFFQLEDGSRVEVVKVDDSSHGEKPDIHIDRYYRELGADVKQFDTDISGWADAEKHIRENWERLANTYYRNHGHQPRDDGVNV